MTQYTYTAEQEKMMEKIKKLLALAAGTTFPDEAASAIAKAQELLFKYNLSMADVSHHSDSVDEDINEIVKDGITLKKGVPENWQKTLVYGVARYNFCRSVFFKTHKWKYAKAKNTPNYMEVVGAKHNIIVVQYLVTYLQREIFRMAQAAKTDYEYEHKRFAPDGFVTAYCVGAVHTVVDRLREKYDALQNSADNARALVLVTDSALEAKLTEFYGVLGTGKSTYRGSLNSTGYYQGVEDAKNIPLNTAVTPSSYERNKQIA